MCLRKLFIHLLTIFIYAITLFAQANVELERQDDRLKRWSNQFSVQMNDAFEDSLGFSKLQSLIEKASFTSNLVDGREFLDNISVAIDKKLQVAIRALVINKEKIESAYLVTSEAVKTSCCKSGLEMRSYDERFNRKVNKSFTCVVLRSTQDNPHLTTSLESIYKRNLIQSAAIKWQYFGSNSGSYHQYPSSDDVCSKSEIFDPRLR